MKTRFCGWDLVIGIWTVFAIQPYPEQSKVWPASGRHILAQFDDDTVVVYQAYGLAIGQYAAKRGRFGGDFSFSRMSWVKPNFLWMMYRSGWGTKANQEVTLALRLRRKFFDSILAAAVSSTWDRRLFQSSAEWSAALKNSSVRLQWDPDHDPTGARIERRAIQLGLRGETLEAFSHRELIEVINLSEFVSEQRARLSDSGAEGIVIPLERVYRPEKERIAYQLGLAAQVVT